MTNEERHKSIVIYYSHVCNHTLRITNTEEVQIEGRVTVCWWFWLHTIMYSELCYNFWFVSTYSARINFVTLTSLAQSFYLLSWENIAVIIHYLKKCLGIPKLKKSSTVGALPRCLAVLHHAATHATPAAASVIGAEILQRSQTPKWFLTIWMRWGKIL